MKPSQLIVTCFLGISLSVANAATLEEEFRNPPEWTRPWCYWFWMDGDVSEEGITKDLEVMAKLGIQRAIIMNVNHNEEGTGPVKTMSAQWRELNRYALREAARLGVEFAMFNGPGWSQSGGPWNEPHQAMRYVTWNEVQAEGGTYTENVRPQGIHVQDIAVLAFPRVSSVTIKKPCTTSTIEFTHSTPFVARSLTFNPNQDNYSLVANLFAKQSDGKQVLAREINETVIGQNAATSFLPLGPETFSFKGLSAKTFVLQISHASGVGSVELSSEPRVQQVIEKQLGRMHPTPSLRWDTYIFPDTVQPDDPRQVVNPDQIINLTDKLDAAGTLSCQLPPGQWTVIYFGMTPTGKTNAPASLEATGLECDKMSKAAIEHHFNSMFSQLFSEMTPLERSVLKAVTIDSYEVGSQNWTDGFAEMFAARVGYDPIAYLPVLTGRVVKSAKASDGFLWSLRRLVADLIAENYVGGMRDIAHRHGLTVWLENYGHWGFPAEFLQYGGHSDDIGGEFWTNGTLGNIECRAASSAAHIYGKRRVYAEAYTSAIDLADHPYLIKARGEEMFCEGINHFVLTVYTHQPRTGMPGKNPAYGTAFHRNTPWFNKSGSFVKYLRRIHLMLQQGEPVADVAVYIGDFAPQMAGPENPVPPGYDFDYINSDVIMTRLRVVEGEWVVYEENDAGKIAARYKLLAMPRLKYIRPQVRASLDRLVGQGGKLTGSLPVTPELLQEMGVTPIVSDTTWPILWKHRKTADADIFFVSNFNQTGLFSATFRSKGRRPEILDPVSGEAWRTPWFEEAPNGTKVTLNVKDPADSFFVVFREGPVWPAVVSAQRDGKDVSADSMELTCGPEGQLIAQTAAAGDYVVKLSDGTNRQFSVEQNAPARILDGPWKITFDAANSTAANSFSVKTDRLTAWNQFEDEKAGQFRGTAYYETTFAADPHFLKPDLRVYLDLGSVNVMARVTVNGQTFDTLWMPPFQVDVTELLKKGDNELNVEVTSRCPDDAPGLLGPVRLRAATRMELKK